MAVTTIDPLHGANGALCILTGKAFGLVTGDFTLGDNATLSLPAIPVTGKVRVRFNIKLSAGAATLNCDLATTTTYASADETLALSGTSELTLSFDTDGTATYVVPEIVAGAAGATIANLEVLVYGLFASGKDHPVNVRTAFDSLAGDGTFLTTAGN